MPLPTRPSTGVAGAPGGSCRMHDQARRLGAALRDAEQQSHVQRANALLVEHVDRRARRRRARPRRASANSRGVSTLPGSLASVAREVRGTADDAAARARPRRSRRRPRRARRSTTVAGARSGALVLACRCRRRNRPPRGRRRPPAPQRAASVALRTTQPIDRTRRQPRGVAARRGHTRRSALGVADPRGGPRRRARSRPVLPAAGRDAAS